MNRKAKAGREEKVEGGEGEGSDHQTRKLTPQSDLRPQRMCKSTTPFLQSVADNGVINGSYKCKPAPLDRFVNTGADKSKDLSARNR